MSYVYVLVRMLEKVIVVALSVNLLFCGLAWDFENGLVLVLLTDIA